MRFSALLLAVAAASPALAATPNTLVPNITAAQVQSYVAQPAPMPPAPVPVSAAVPVSALAAAGVAAAFATPAGGVLAAALVGGTFGAVASGAFDTPPAPAAQQPSAMPMAVAPVKKVEPTGAGAPATPVARVTPVRPLSQPKLLKPSPAAEPIELEKHIQR